MKKWQAVEVQWVDAHGGDLSWGTLTGRQHGPKKIRSVGMLYKEDKTGVTIALSKDAARVDCYVFVPRGCIVSVRALR